MSGDEASAQAPAAPMAAALLVANERVKLTATWLNGLAVAVFAVGGFAPFIAATVTPVPSTPGGLRIASPSVFIVIGICWVASVIPHISARWSLRKLVA